MPFAYHRAPLTANSRVPKNEGVSQPVFEAWVLYYSENQYDVERTSFCGLNFLKSYETSSPYVGYRTPTYKQDELCDMTLNAVNGYHAAHKRSLPSRLIRGRAKSYEQDLDQRIQTLPRPVQSELNLLLGDRESATCNRFHRRDWTVVMMREEYRYKFATAEHEEVKKSKRFWKKGDKRPIHYFFILRGEDGRVATDDKGMHTATRHGNPWKRVDEKERREKQRARNTRRYGKGFVDDNVWFNDRHRNDLSPHPPPPPFGRGPAPDFAFRRGRLEREDVENFPPVNPFSFGPPRCANGVTPSPFPPHPPPPPLPFSAPISCGPMPPPSRFSCPLPAVYGQSCVCRNAPLNPPPPPPPPPPVMPLTTAPRAPSFFNEPNMHLRSNLPPAMPPMPRPSPYFPMPPPPPPPFPLREFSHSTPPGGGIPPHLGSLTGPPRYPYLYGNHSFEGSDRYADRVPFPAIPTEYTGSSVGSSLPAMPFAPRLSNLTTPTTFSRVTSNHTGSSIGHPASTSTPASPLPEEDDEDEDEAMSESSYESGSSQSSRSASPVPPMMNLRSGFSPILN